MVPRNGNEILQIMNHQEEMFLGGLNDPLMATALGYTKEMRDEFKKVTKALQISKFFKIIQLVIVFKKFIY